MWGDDDDIFLGTVRTSQSNSYGSVTIPSNVTPGEYQLLLQITPVPVDGVPLPADSNPNDDVFDAGALNVQAADASSTTPVADDDALVGGSLDQSTAAAGSFVDAVPQTLVSGAYDAYDTNVQVVLSTDGIFGNGDDISLTNANPAPTSQNYDPSNGDPNLIADFNYDGVVNSDDYSLFTLGGDAESTEAGTLDLNGNGGEQGGQSTVVSPVELGWNNFHAGEMQIPATVPSGTYQVLMQVSPYDGPGTTVPGDTDPTDDVFNAGTLTVTPYVAPSIQITQTTFPSTTPAGGSEIDVEPTVVQSGVLSSLDYNISVALSPTSSWNSGTQLLPETSANSYGQTLPDHGGEFQISIWDLVREPISFWCR